MTEEIKSEGKCLFCGEKFVKAGINRHLQKHLKERSVHAKPGKSFLVKVEPNPSYWPKPPYFLSLWIDGETPLGEVDDFLRLIWLECCGHMSSFTDPSKRRQASGGMWGYFEAEELLEKGKMAEYEKLMEQIKGEIPLSRAAKKALSKGVKLEYEYDYGSTTALQLTVVDEYPLAADQRMVLLSRNEPLGFTCVTCGHFPAVSICTVCDDEYEAGALFCGKCAKKHAKTCEDFEDYAAMPVVNSPRTGVCAYIGGRIDTERDGVFLTK